MISTRTSSVSGLTVAALLSLTVLFSCPSSSVCVAAASSRAHDAVEAFNALTEDEQIEALIELDQSSLNDLDSEVAFDTEAEDVTEADSLASSDVEEVIEPGTSKPHRHNRHGMQTRSGGVDSHPSSPRGHSPRGHSPRGDARGGVRVVPMTEQDWADIESGRIRSINLDRSSSLQRTSSSASTEGMPTPDPSVPWSHVMDFDEWNRLHGKVHHSRKVMDKRRKIFEHNMKLVEAHNALYDAGLSTYRLGATPHADLTHQEYKETKLTTGLAKMDAQRLAEFEQWQQETNVVTADTPASNTRRHGLHRVHFGETSVHRKDEPTEVDWRNFGYVNKPKDQGQCGSCWAFSATGALESAWAKWTNETLGQTQLLSLSEQELVDCANAGYNTCENGGEMYQGMEWAIQHGIAERKQYKYKGTSAYYQSTCGVHNASATDLTVVPKRSNATFEAIANVQKGSEKALQKAVRLHPTISIAIDASHPSFQLYADGVYDEPDCKNGNNDLDHGVGVVGFGTDEQTKLDYWLVRNSWGKSWGDHGYIRMVRNKKNQCGVATMAVFPLVEKPHNTRTEFAPHPIEKYYESEEEMRAAKAAEAAAEEAAANAEFEKNKKANMQ